MLMLPGPHAMIQALLLEELLLEVNLYRVGLFSSALVEKHIGELVDEHSQSHRF